MKHTLPRLTAILFAMLLAAPAAFAQGDDLSKLLTHAPANKEGMVTREAYLKQAAAAFDTMDKDKKAALKARGATTDKALTNLLVHSADKEGTVTREQYLKYMGQQFDKADKAKRGMMGEQGYRNFVDGLAKP
jgi:hypothetical protein